jgi:adenine-specific DNA glycosylase
VAMALGLDEGLLPDLWNFPSAFGNSRREAFERLQEKMATAAPFPIEWHESSYDDGRGSLLRMHHRITHRSIEVDVYGADARVPPGSKGLIRWSSLGTLKNAAVSQLARKIANSLVGNARA